MQMKVSIQMGQPDENFLEPQTLSKIPEGHTSGGLCTFHLGDSHGLEADGTAAETLMSWCPMGHCTGKLDFSIIFHKYLK